MDASSKSYKISVAPRALPLIGHIAELRKKPLNFFSSLSEHGDLVEVRFGPYRVYAVCHPDLAQHMLFNPRIFDKGGPLFDKSRLLVGDGLVTCGWESHRSQRRMLQPAFRQSRIDHYSDIMWEEAEKEVSWWQPGATIDIPESMARITTRVTARTLFSANTPAMTLSAIQRHLPVFLTGTYHRMFVPAFFSKFPTQGNRRYREAWTALRKLVLEIIEMNRERASENPDSDMVCRLLAARDEKTGNPLTDEEIIDQAITMLTAGIETTANALSWTLYEVSQRPDMEKNLHTEVDRVLDRSNPESRDVAQLAYTQRLLTESLRMYPPGWLLSRVTTQDTILGGKFLPAGSSVLLSPYLIHHNRALFREPSTFDPDRWLPSRAKLLPRGAMLAFGGGNRKCIGDVFASTEAVIALGTIASRWRLRVAPGTVMVPKPALSLSPGRLHMVAEPR